VKNVALSKRLRHFSEIQTSEVSFPAKPAILLLFKWSVHQPGNLSFSGSNPCGYLLATFDPDMPEKNHK